MSILYSGGISGAILDPESKEALKHAELYYKEIRKMTTDIQKIANNTGYDVVQIALIKNYLFIDIHNLDDNKKQQFDPSFQIAESWRRLAFDKNNIKEHDLLLLKHEMHEMKLVLDGTPQRLAHDETNKIYNYQKASDLYYENLSKEKSKIKQKEEIELKQKSLQNIDFNIKYKTNKRNYQIDEMER